MIIFYCVVVFSMCIGDARIQDKKVTAQDVIKRYIEAKGGRKNLEKIRSFRYDCTVSVDGDLVCRCRSYFANGKYRSEDTFLDGAKKVTGCNGKIAWLVDVDGKCRLLSSKETQAIVRESATLHPWKVWLKMGSGLKLIGLEKVEGKQAYHLEFKEKGGHKIHRYFSKKTGLLVREIQNIPGPVFASMDSLFYDYQKGPFETLSVRKRINWMTTKDGKTYKVDFAVVAVEVNKIDEGKDFLIPEGIKTLIKNSRNEVD